MMKTFHVLGVMSGSSADGVDMAFCKFCTDHGNWKFSILHAETKAYSSHELALLKTLPSLSGEELIEADRQFSQWYAQRIMDFINKHHVKPELIGFHGHTVFHNPRRGYTFQLGHGGVIASLTQIPVVSDFRSQDVALGGEGAPLVPLGDEIFFSQYDAVLNIGGIANLSFRENNQRKGYDIVPANQLLNYLAQKMLEPFDNQGSIARRGNVIEKLLQSLLETYGKKTSRKSLAREEVEKHYLPLLHEFLPNYSIPDLLRTTTEFIAETISRHIQPFKSVLTTGGGAYNTFLIELIRQKLPKHQIVLPEKQLIDFKEAMIFAFLALRRFLIMNTTLRSVTNAQRNAITGALWYP